MHLSVHKVQHLRGSAAVSPLPTWKLSLMTSVAHRQLPGQVMGRQGTSPGAFPAPTAPVSAVDAAPHRATEERPWSSRHFRGSPAHTWRPAPALRGARKCAAWPQPSPRTWDPPSWGPIPTCPQGSPVAFPTEWRGDLPLFTFARRLLSVGPPCSFPVAVPAPRRPPQSVCMPGGRTSVCKRLPA